MARSPLMRALIHLARNFQCARKLGVPVEAVVERDRRVFSRRRFLIGAAASAVAAQPAWAHLGRATAPRVAIVGAGISGLTCALTLADAGINATLYEAAARVGGRMFSNNSGYWNDGQITEWCGELIDTEHTSIRALATRFGLALDDLLAAQPAGSSDTYFFKSGYYSIAEAVTDFQPVFNAVQADAAAVDLPNGDLTPLGIRIDLWSVWTWIQRRVPGGHDSRMGRLLDAAYAEEYGADTRDLSGLNIVYQLSGSDRNFEILGTSDERFHIRGGNELLPQAVADYLRTQNVAIQTSMSMTAIRNNADGTYRLSFDVSGGTQDIDADLVVLTLPFAVLRTLDYRHAGFDALKQLAIRALGRGQNGKLQLQFDARVWNSAGAWGVSTGSTFSDLGYQNTWDVTRAQAGNSGVLNDYTGGSATRHMRSKLPFANINETGVQTDAANFLGQIETVFPGLRPRWNGKATSSLPHLSPYFQCSYAYYKPGQINSFSGYEGVRQGNVFFAGEHTSVNFQGYMEGAVEEGARAANEIITQLV